MNLLQILGASGGAPSTVNMQPQYQKYNIDQQTNGQTPLGWAEWLKTQGYQLHQNGQVYPMPRPQQPSGLIPASVQNLNTNQG